jgi:anaerobic magnesium-protoporphyrin IX monomethyl ester cyclase
MARVLLVNPNKWGRGITAIWIPAHTAVLRSRGHDVRLFDSTFFRKWTVDEVSYNTNNAQYRPTDYHGHVRYSDEDVVASLQKVVDEFQPDVIFWSAISSHIHGEGEYVNIQYGYELVQQIKTQAMLVTAGLQATARPTSMFERFPKTSFFIGGESEFVLADIVDSLGDAEKIQSLKGVIWRDSGKLRVNGEHENGKVIVNPRQEIISNLDSIPPYDYSIFDPQVFWRPYNGAVVKGVDFELSRGCIFTCSYCVETVIQKYYGVTEKSPRSGALMQPQKYLRAKSGKRVYEELKALNEKFGVTLVRCQDTNFLTINRNTLKELADLMDANPLPVKLYVETRVDRLTASDIELLKRLRVDGVGTGIELSSEAFRQDFLNRFAAADKLQENFKLLRAAGIRRTTYNIIGLPRETEDMILDTIRFNRELDPDNITVAFYSPYIGTEQAEIGKDEQYFDEYEYHVDGQLRSVSKSTLVDVKTLDFYKKYFSTLVREGLDKLPELKRKEGLNHETATSCHRDMASQR